MGIEVHRSIKDLPEGIDLATIILPASSNVQAIRECVRNGIAYFVLAAGGFSEVDDEGVALQEKLVRVISETGIRVIGPNTSGHTSTLFNFTSSFFPLDKIPRGNISFINQTGNFATHTMRYIMTGEHFGVARAKLELLYLSIKNVKLFLREPLGSYTVEDDLEYRLKEIYHLFFP